MAINTGRTPKQMMETQKERKASAASRKEAMGKKIKEKHEKESASKKPKDDMSAKKASKKDIDKAVKAGKARYAK